jgi:HEPN domain-containing protein
LLKRKDLQKLAALRLKEARILLDHRCWEGAYYLAGYSVECALKACLAKRTERHEFPDKEQVLKQHTHNLDVLVNLAKLEKERDALIGMNLEFDRNWKVVRKWSERSRYHPPATDEAEKLINAISSRGTAYYDG